MSGFIRISLEVKDEDEDVLLNKKDIRIVRINTLQISSFRPSKDKKETELFLSGGEMYILNMDTDRFEDLVGEVDNVFEFMPHEN